MIDAKEAVLLAKRGAVDWLGRSDTFLEEIERESYKGRDVWAITLSLKREPSELPALQVLREPLKYKLFLVDATTGEVLAMKVREPATQ